MRLIALSLLFGLAVLSPAMAADPIAIGMIKTLEGSASIKRASQTTAATAGTLVFQDDAISTGADSALGLTLNDGTTVSLGHASRLVLDRFVYDPGHGDAAMGLNLIRGTFAYTSGRVGSIAPQNVALHTPTATIGIRGTHFVVHVAGE